MVFSLFRLAEGLFLLEESLFHLAENSPACKQTGVPPNLFGTSYPAPWHEDLREVNSHPLHWSQMLLQLLLVLVPRLPVRGQVWDDL